jgi:hypothetical protein
MSTVVVIVSVSESVNRLGGDISDSVLLQHILSVVTSIEQRVVNIEMHLQTRQSELVQLSSTEFNLGALAAELSFEERSILHRCPIIKNDDDWDAVETMLSDSGPHGALFKSLKDRLVDRSDAHKTANATLRALMSESFIAEHVTMAGYKKGKK